jgi:hypothetical protein
MNVLPGDRVRCRTSNGGWFETTARSEPRVDWAKLFHRQSPYVSVAVDHPAFGEPINWPADDVFPLEDWVTLLIERYRKALMAEHAHDWTMEVISEAAHICARTHES